MDTPRPSDDTDDRFADERVNQRSRPLIGYVALLLSASYAVLGIALFFVPAGKLTMPRPWRIGLSVVLIVYGTLRVWRSYNRYYR